MSWSQDSTQGPDLRCRLQKALHSRAAARCEDFGFLSAARLTLSDLAKCYLITVVVPVQDQAQQRASARPGTRAEAVQLTLFQPRGCKLEAA